MKTSKELLKTAGIFPKLRLGIKTGNGVKSNGSHKVKILKDRIIKKNDPTSGQEVEYVRYLVEENGEQKVYDTRKLNKTTGELSYFVQRMAEINEGDEVILEMKKQGIKNYIEITPTGHTSSVAIEEDEDDTESIEIEEPELDDLPN